MWGEGRNTEQRKTEKKRERFFSRMRNSFQLRVLLSILLPIIIFCVLTNIVISTLLGRQLMEKREDVERGFPDRTEAVCAGNRKQRNQGLMEVA